MPKWLQLCNNATSSGLATVINVPLRGCEPADKQQAANVEPQQQAVKLASKRLRSRIPRMIRPRGNQSAAGGIHKLDPTEAKQLRSGQGSAGATRIASWSCGKAAAAVERNKATLWETRSAKAIGVGAKGYSFGGFGMINTDRSEFGRVGIAATAAAVPVVRSTRTSRCRMQLRHPERPATSRATDTSTLLSQATVKGPQKLKQMLVERSYFQLYRHKCYTDPLLLPERSVSTILKPFNELLKRERLLRFECSDQKRVNVSCRLINRFSPLICERQKEPQFNICEPIELHAVSSATLRRLVLWMEHHCNDDVKQLQKMPPTLVHSVSEQCTWDERFLGSDLNEVLQLLLAANCLGVYPLVEHAMLYFIELIEERNHAERICCYSQDEFN